MLGVDGCELAGVEAGEHRIARTPPALHVLGIGSAGEHHRKHGDFVDAFLRGAGDVSGEVPVGVTLLVFAQLVGIQLLGRMLPCAGDGAERVLPEPGVDVLFSVALLDLGLVGGRAGALERRHAHDQRTGGDEKHRHHAVAGQARRARFRFSFQDWAPSDRHEPSHRRCDRDQTKDAPTMKESGVPRAGLFSGPASAASTPSSVFGHRMRSP